jgi:cell wall-associated NlpC family hydrolase
VAKSTTGRHRAELPVSTPLTGVTETLTTALATPVSAAGKGGLVVAVSSGLVAGVGLPGSAALQTTRAAKTPTASIPLLGAADAATATDAEAGAVAAASTAKVDFEHEAFRPVAKHAAATTSAARASLQVSRVSRSLARAAYQAQVKASAPRAQHRSPAAVTRPRIARTHTTAPTPKAIPVGHSSAVAIASRYLGVPYRYGGSSPRGFDCSGFTQYVYGQLGKSLPRTSSQQYNATTHISRSSARPGDLVFFFTGGRVSHVGIYAGGNMMIASPHTGDVVKRQEIYSANVAFGRV